ncbi:hypothetical protein Taro_041114, partial [Colocasia esculenta]|nr:hypothetical protein [Colocasia esculenta]
RQQLCCACRAEKLASRSLDAGASAGVHVWTLTLAQRPGLDAKNMDMEEVCSSSSSLSSFSSHSQVVAEEYRSSEEEAGKKMIRFCHPNGAVFEYQGEVQWLWTFRVAVVLGGIGVDANLRILQLPEGTEGWLDDRRMRGVAELRKETSWRGAIPVGARGGFGVNREIARGVKATCQLLRSPESPAYVTRGLEAVYLSEDLSQATLLPSPSFPFFFPPPLQGGEASLCSLRWLGRGGVLGELVAERRSIVERGGGSRGFVKAHLGLLLHSRCRWCSVYVFKASCMLCVGEERWCVAPRALFYLLSCLGFCLGSRQVSRYTRQKATYNLSHSGGDRLSVTFPSALQSPSSDRGGGWLVSKWLAIAFLLKKATHLWSRSGYLVSVLPGGVLGSRALPCVPALADGPSGGFRKGYRACLCLMGLSWLQAS